MKLKILKIKKRSNYIPGFNYSGPFTDLKYNLRNSIKHANGLNKLCKEHDIFYSKSDDRILDDIIFIKIIRNMKKEILTLREKIFSPIFCMMIKI